MRNKRGQAALEFLMTYGWAILVVLVVIGALAYFGVLNPNILVPEKCTMATGLSCKDYKISGSSVFLYFENGMGKTIEVTNVSVLNPQDSLPICTDDAKGDDSGTTITLNGTSGNEVPIVNGGGTNFSISGCTFTNAGRKEKVNLEVTYYFADSTSDFSHVVTGELLATVQ